MKHTLYSVISDIDLSAAGEGIIWLSDNEAVISSSGAVTRQNEDCTVTLTGTKGSIRREFVFTVLKNAVHVNDEVLLSYDLAGTSDSVIRDNSGNGNHAVDCGGMTGGYFDGVDDYVELPKGILYGQDEYSIVMNITPEITNTHQFTFCFGNSNSSYFFLNTSRPNTLTVRAAITNSGGGNEKDIRSYPGLRHGENYDLIITAKGTEYTMYINGLPVASGDLELSVSDLGETTLNHLAKSPYNDPLFKGRINEFTVYSYVMDEDSVYEKYFKEEAVFSAYFENLTLGSELTAVCRRNSMVAVSFFDSENKLIYATTKKVSDDNLTVSFDAKSAVKAEISAFDPATGIVKEMRVLSLDTPIVAYRLNGGCLKIENSSDSLRSASVITAVYEYGQAKNISITTHDIEAGSFEVIPVNIPENGKLFVWNSLSGTIPIEEI